MTHYVYKPASRKWKEDMKTEAENLLKSKMPAAARIEFCAKGDMEAIRLGKLTSIKTTKTFQMVKEKVEFSKISFTLL